MEDKKITMPAVALRGLTILPGMVQHFDISREKSIRAIETAMMGNQKVYLVTQRHPEQETPAVADQTARENAGRYHPCDGGRR